MICSNMSYFQVQGYSERITKIGVQVIAPYCHNISYNDNYCCPLPKDSHDLNQWFYFQGKGHREHIGEFRVQV